jgi:hypothetical protein
MVSFMTDPALRVLTKCRRRYSSRHAHGDPTYNPPWHRQVLLGSNRMAPR